MTSPQAGDGSTFPHEISHTILPSALDALRRDWSVIPLIGGEDAKYGKRPAIRWQHYQQTRPTEAMVREWFTDGERSAFGVVCGNGLIVIDFDDTEQQARFLQAFPDVLNTRIVKSGGRGLLHLYFMVDFPVRSQKLDGVDLQSDGRYVVGAGSRIAGGEWILINNAEPLALSRDQLDEIIRFLTPDKQPSMPQSESFELPTSQSPGYFVVLYRAKVIEFKGRNDALFYTGCQMRDAGFNQADVIGALADVHAAQSPMGAHAPESYQQRYREAERTIQSVFSRPPRSPITTAQPKRGDASYLPNALREVILQQEDGNALLRTLEGLILADVQPGEELTERRVCKLLTGDVGRWSVRKALTYSPSPGPPSPAEAETATLRDTTKNCVFVPLPKPDKSPAHRPPQRYLMPSVAYLCQLFSVEAAGSDPITQEDIRSVKKYRSALNRELIRRRPAKYTQKWLAERLRVSRSSIQRYLKAEPIKSRWILEEMRLHWGNLNQIPTGKSAEKAGIAIRHCFLRDDAGKRYPPLIGIARKLLGEGKQIWLMTRICKMYWVEEAQETPVRERIRISEPGSRKFFQKIDYPVSDKPLPLIAKFASSVPELPNFEPTNELYPTQRTIHTSPQREIPSPPPERSPRYYKKPLLDDRDEYTATKLYDACKGKMRREEARKLVDHYGRRVVGRARWWMEKLMQEGKIENPPGFFKVHVRVAWLNLYGSPAPPYESPPKRKRRKKPYDLTTDSIQQSDSWRKWRQTFDKEPWELATDEIDF